VVKFTKLGVNLVVGTYKLIALAILFSASTCILNCFMLSFLPGFPTFCHSVIPTSQLHFYCFFLFTC